MAERNGTFFNQEAGRMSTDNAVPLDRMQTHDVPEHDDEHRIVLPHRMDKGTSKGQGPKRRYIDVGDKASGGTQTAYVSNYIRTTKYTLVTFLPKNLWEQFQRVANTYFLFIAVLSSFSFSPKTPFVSILPLVFVLTVTAVKEALEDYNRYKSDQEINARLVNKWDGKKWILIPWTDVSVGDVLKVLDNEQFPADLMMLQSSVQQGICNIETSNLDGETNLKIKQAIPETYEIKADVDSYPSRVSFTLESEGPNEKMDKNSWKGNLLRFNGNKEKLPVSFTQLLLRGCQLKNTKWIITVVVFTGKETKLMLQNKGKKLKRSNVDRLVDKALYVIFAVQAVICIFGAVAFSIWTKNTGRDHWYLPFVDSSDTAINDQAFERFFTYVVLVDLLVPISLYVSMELVKAVQAWFINMDIQMYHEDNDIPARARTSNLNEELGQIEYIFSDKTGTLTRNQMEFLRCSVAGVDYGPGRMAAAGESPDRHPPRKGIPPFAPLFRFEDTRLVNNLINKHETKKQIDEFLSLLAVCHTVVPEYPGSEDDHMHAMKSGTPVKYQAASPDELALVLAAAEAQYFFHFREPVKFNLKGLAEINGQRCKVNVLGKNHDFCVLEILEFNSTRKRMSVIVLDPRDKKIKIYCKGADNVIRERCNKKSLAKFWKVTEKHLQDYAVEGLRTLCLAYRTISKKEFQQWFAAHTKAKTSIDNREQEVMASSAMIEKDLELLGATAIEDRLQEGVPEAIAKLAQAGIKIWVLTGDKVETAINIGRSCHLLTPRMRGKNLLVIDIDESLDDEKAKAETLEALEHSQSYLTGVSKEESEHIGIVVSGKALGYVFPIRLLDAEKREIIPPQHILDEEQALQERFLDICTRCKAVVCCRMSPKQKSQVVALVKNNTKSLTLAIGDGANDVAMIEAAHVGVGIEGLEGKQAVMAADYAIGQFRFLLRLLLVHGAWSYRRLSLLILYSFYKNVTISMIGIWFVFFSGYSAQVFIEPISGSVYNMMFTSLPVMAAAIFNRDVSEESMLKYPELYKSGPLNEKFNLGLLGRYIVEGFLHSLVLFFFTVFSFNVSTLPSGEDNDLWIASSACYTCLVLLVNYKIALQTTTFVMVSHVLLWASVLVWFLFSMALSNSLEFAPDMYWVFFRLLRMGNFWFLILMAPITCMLPDLAWEFVRSTYYFTQTDIIREREKGYITGPDLSIPTAVTRGQTESALGAKDLADMKAKLEQKEQAQAKSKWAVVADKVKQDHLGFVPFIEDETGDAFVMGQQEFLKRYLVVKSHAPVNIQTSEDGGARASDSLAEEKGDL